MHAYMLGLPIAMCYDHGVSVASVLCLLRLDVTVCIVL